MSIENVLYRANATATGRREGRGISDDRAIRFVGQVQQITVPDHASVIDVRLTLL